MIGFVNNQAPYFNIAPYFNMVNKNKTSKSMNRLIYPPPAERFIYGDK